MARGSGTETYVAMKLSIDNWRWAGVPFYLRTGKRMAVRRTEIAIQFKQAPFALFRDTPVERLEPNFMVLRIQPDEGDLAALTPRSRGPPCASPASGWSSATPTGSSQGRASATRRCSTTP